jgi:hypothetical protein
VAALVGDAAGALAALISLERLWREKEVAQVTQQVIFPLSK